MPKIGAKRVARMFDDVPSLLEYLHTINACGRSKKAVKDFPLNDVEALYYAIDNPDWIEYLAVAMRIFPDSRFALPNASLPNAYWSKSEHEQADVKREQFPLEAFLAERPMTYERPPRWTGSKRGRWIFDDKYTCGIERCGACGQAIK